jgi:hypothetical protein
MIILLLIDIIKIVIERILIIVILSIHIKRINISIVKNIIILLGWKLIVKMKISLLKFVLIKIVVILVVFIAIINIHFFYSLLVLTNKNKIHFINLKVVLSHLFKILTILI